MPLLVSFMTMCLILNVWVFPSKFGTIISSRFLNRWSSSFYSVYESQWVGRVGRVHVQGIESQVAPIITCVLVGFMGRRSCGGPPLLNWRRSYKKTFKYNTPRWSEIGFPGSTNVLLVLKWPHIQLHRHWCQHVIYCYFLAFVKLPFSCFRVDQFLDSPRLFRYKCT